MNKRRIFKITEIFAKLAFTAVLADLFYIIFRMRLPAITVDDALFINHIPEMLEHMLLSVTVTVAFLAVMTCITKHESDN